MDDALHILLKRFRRRLVLARAVRLLAMASLGTAAVCLAAALIQRFTGTPLLERAAIACGSVAAIWIVIQFRHRPTLAAAALEIDRQQNLRELLSSAALAQHRQGFDGCVVAAATERAATVQVETLRAGSLGAPAWVAALLLVGVLPLVYRAPSGSPGETVTLSPEMARTAEGNAAPAARALGQAQQRSIPQPQTPGASAISMQSAVDSGNRPLAALRPTRSDTAGRSTGGGLAQDQQNTSATPPASAVPSAQAERGGDNASGGGIANASSSGTSTGTGQVNVTGEQADAATGGAARMQGKGELDARSIPQGYRDVLKAYFAR